MPELLSRDTGADSPPSWPERVGLTLYRSHLRIVPLWLRRRAGVAMLATFSERQRDLYQNEGASRLPLLWAKEIAGLLRLSNVIPDSRGNTMDGILQDIRFAARVLRRNPGFAVTSVITLAFGLGLTATMFSIQYGVVYRGLPFEEPEAILHLERQRLSQGIRTFEVTQHDYADWQRQQTTFEQLAAFSVGTVNLSGSERAERYEGAWMTANAFEALRVDAALGRTFRADEEAADADAVVLLGHALWRDRFEAAPDIIGTLVRANGLMRTVVGVMPEGFVFPQQQDLWLPLQTDPLPAGRDEGATLEVFGRLAAGATIDTASSELATITQRLAEAYPETNEGIGAVIKPFTREYIDEEDILLSHTMMGTGLFVLLIACANVANLLLSRSFERSREVALRTAVGARRSRVVRQLMIEVGMLATAGAAIGLALTSVSIDWFNRAMQADADVPFFVDIRLDWPVFLFVIAVTALASLLAGTLPALQATGRDIAQALQSSARTGGSARLGRLSRGLMVLQVALSCGLLVGAGLSLRTIANLRDAEFGFAADSIATARFGVMEADYPDAESRRRFFEETLTALEALPGATAASLTSGLPTTGYVWGTRFALDGEAYTADSEYPITNLQFISPGYFDTFETSLLSGRLFGALDVNESEPVVVVNTSFVEQFFLKSPDAGDSPADMGALAIGRRVRFGGSEAADSTESTHAWRTIVGVVPDLYMDGLENDMPYGLYVPVSQWDLSFLSLAVRTTGDSLTLVPAIRAAVASVDRDVPIYWAKTMRGVIEEEAWVADVLSTLFAIMGAGALFLAGTGLYGVMSFAVNRRGREVAVRMALGAKIADVRGMVVRQGLLQLAFGLLLGMVFAWFVGGLLESKLVGVQPRDALVFIGVAAALAIAGTTAAYLPARRATRIDPITTLRNE